MSAQSVTPMAKPSRERDYDRSEVKKDRRYKKRNVDSGKRGYVEDAARGVRDDA